MRWLEVWVLSGVLACSSATSPSHTPDEPRSRPGTQEEPQPVSASQPASQPPSLPSSEAAAPPESALSPSTVIQLIELSPEDPLSKEAAAMVGLLCAAVEGRLLLEDDRVTGEARCGPKRALTRLVNTKISIVYQEHKTPPDPDPAATFKGPSLAVGRTFVIHRVDGKDAYFKRAAQLVGCSCVVTRELQHHGDGWFDGSGKCIVAGRFEYMYFASVSIEAK